MKEAFLQTNFRAKTLAVIETGKALVQEAKGLGRGTLALATLLRSALWRRHIQVGAQLLARNAGCALLIYYCRFGEEV
jgi:hypothetical protein